MLSELALFMDPASPVSLSRLHSQHRWTDGDPPSLRRVSQRHHHPSTVTIRFLFLNTFLMDVDPPASWFEPEGQKPAVDDRAKRLGIFLKTYFDVAALCEVFEINVRELITSQWPPDDRPTTSSAIRSASLGSSGLVTLSQSSRVVRRDFHEFDEDSGESLAGKGVLLSDLDIGIGGAKLEIYSTHLHAEDAGVRRHQIDEIKRFVRDTHRRENPAFLVGDFNVKASASEYSHLEETANNLGFRDVWSDRNGSPGFTSEMQNPEIAQLICRPANDDSEAVAAYASRLGHEPPGYCDDSAVPTTPPGPSGRIDYAFLSEPSASHGFNVDFTRPRRVRMERRRDAPERNKIAFLSDHVGVSMTLILSPR